MRIPQGASPEIQQVIRDLWTEIDKLRSPVVQLNGRRIRGAADAVDPTDYTTLQQVKKLIEDA